MIEGLLVFTAFGLLVSLVAIVIPMVAGSEEDDGFD